MLEYEKLHNERRKYIKYHFQLIDKRPLVLTYELQPNSLRERWISHFNERNSEPDSYLNLKLDNKTAKDITFLMNKLNSIVEEINSFYDRQLPLFTDVKEIDRDILNYLHEQFEEYGERHQQIVVDQRYHENLIEGNPDVWPGTKFNKDFHEAWMSLNEWIHITESAMLTTEESFPHFSCLVHTYPPVPGEPLVEMDKLFLETNFKWGRIYLGYNTLGKDYSHTCQDNDVRVLPNDQIKVQTLFSTEMWLNFSLGSELDRHYELRFYLWYNSLEPEMKKLVPIDDLNTLALGRYYMGNILINETFLNFHPVTKDWYNNEELKKKWNHEVFSQIEKVVKVEVIE